tara:strand:+ start:1806 stop:2414 length:609 start_codon:yes stop_codon:yes gene_type:complete
VVSSIEVEIKDKLTNDVSAKTVIKKMTSIVPQHLLKNIEFIKIGQFRELVDREIQALYKDSTVYVTNRQKSESDLLDDLIHEVAHSVEEVYDGQIYADKIIKKEFLQKRKKMWTLLNAHGFEMELENFLNTKYTKEFDMFLYQTVGYPILSSITSTLFFSPYAATSLREYFANGFEAFFMKKEISRLKSVSPALHKKISNLL